MAMLAFDPQVSSYYKVMVMYDDEYVDRRKNGEKLFDFVHVFSSKIGTWSSLVLSC